MDQAQALKPRVQSICVSGSHRQLSDDDFAVGIGGNEIGIILCKRCSLRCIGGALMRKPDKRTREQRKADESALFAAACLGATILLIAISILATSAQAVDAEPEEAPIAEEYDPAWDIPATECAVGNDVFLGECTLTAYCP